MPMISTGSTLLVPKSSLPLLSPIPAANIYWVGYGHGTNNLPCQRLKRLPFLLRLTVEKVLCSSLSLCVPSQPATPITTLMVILFPSLSDPFLFLLPSLICCFGPLSSVMTRRLRPVASSSWVSPSICSLLCIFSASKFLFFSNPPYCI